MLSIVQGRILGCLLEKERTTPDQYPLSLNATVLAANQSSNREPVMNVAEHEVSAALTDLKALGLVRFVHPTSGRGVTKYRQVLDEKLILEPEDAALLAVLLVRGPQTPGELRPRAERMHGFDSVEAVERVLHALLTRDEPMVQRLERVPGHSAARWQQLVAEEDPRVLEALASGQSSGGSRSSSAEEISALRTRVEQLESRMATLEQLLL